MNEVRGRGRGRGRDRSRCRGRGGASEIGLGESTCGNTRADELGHILHQGEVLTDGGIKQKLSGSGKGRARAGVEDGDHTVSKCEGVWGPEAKRWIVLAPKVGGKEGEMEEWDCN